MARFGAAITDVDGLTLTKEEKTFFQTSNPFGFILFARNIATPEQVRALCAEMRDAVGRDVPIAIDQEGGRVQRMRGPIWTEWSPPLDFVTQAGADAERAMYLRYRLIAAELHDLGIDSNCAPLVDLASDTTHDFLRNRCYGTDPARVAALGRAVANGLLDGGVLPVVKHMPGHGRATIDSHFDMPRVSAPLNVLTDADFAPFRALTDLPMGMTGHLIFEAIDTLPSTLSPKVIDVVRSGIGFDNLLMTDDISMKALTGSLTEISRGAIEAGCDVVLHCNGTLEARREVAEAAGEMSEAAQTRALRAMAARKTPDDIDIPALEAQLGTLVNTA